MTMGKGGVGKTTVAAAVAVALAKKGHRVVLSTTDPAAHIAATIDGALPGLTVTRIDPSAEVRQYTEEVLTKAGQQLDAAGRAMLEEHLGAVHRGDCRIPSVCPHRRRRQGRICGARHGPHGPHYPVARRGRGLSPQGDMPEAVRQLLPRLRDPSYTRVLIVTLPEATPAHEAERLGKDLARAGIKPYAWVINQSLLASGTTHPVLCQRGAYEVPFIRRVVDDLAQDCALIPWLAEPPVGVTGLEHLVAREPGRASDSASVS